MTKPRLCAAALTLCGLVAFATTAVAADCAWALWVEAPTGSAQWTIASGPQSRFGAKGDCQRHADDHNAFEATMHKMQGTSGETPHDAYSCQPCNSGHRPFGSRGSTPS